jgi:hypothetical protein
MDLNKAKHWLTINPMAVDHKAFLTWDMGQDKDCKLEQQF